jgi:PPK2 family polyphosphate:nucleotide phosphotransferase
MGYAHKITLTNDLLLKKFDPGDTHGLKRPEAEERTRALGAEMGELLELLYATGTKSLILVLQGIDTSGKDGTIRHLLTYVNVQSCRVIPFKAPTEEELSHDFLWRVHKEAPGKGQIAVFNRSHYEDVLVVRVHNLVPESVWEKRYDRINEFERLLADSDTLLMKFFLHISKDEQEKRLLARQEDPTKFWKLSAGDWKERELWGDYTHAFEAAISRCSAPHAPWYIVPANKKWFRNLAITEAVVETLRPYRQGWMDHLNKIGEAAKREIEEYRASKPDP